MKRIRKYGYNVECIYSYESTGFDCWDIEKMLHFNYRNTRYKPKIPFKGDTECFCNIDKTEFDFLIQCCR